MTTMLDKVRRLGSGAKAPPAKPALAARFAAPNVKPQAWQTPKAPMHPILGRMRPAVSHSPEIDRVMALPRRTPLDLESPAALAFAAEVTRRFARHNPACSCRKMGRPCLDALKPAQAWALDEMSKAGGLLGPIGVGHGKCLDASAEFFDYSTGRRRSVTEIGAVKVATFDGVLRPAGASAFPSGEKVCVTVRLADGSEIIASNDHPILTQHGWVQAADLTPRDTFVAVPTKMPDVLSPTIATDEEVVLLAYLLSDGGCSQRMMSFTNETPEVIAEFQHVASAVCRGWSERPSQSKARHFSVLGAPYTGFRDKWDLHGLAKDKRMHPALWGLPTRQVALFLNRFWSCDGHVSASALEVTLASEKLIDDVRFLLLRLGIRSRKTHKKASYTKDGARRHFDAWRLTLYGLDAARFLEVVGDVLGKEAACVKLRSRLKNTPRNTNTDVVPVGRPEIRDICDELGMRKRGGARVAGTPRTDVRKFFGATDGQYVSRAKFVEFCARWKYTGRYAHLATTDVAWERVHSVVSAGVRPVYDLTVPGTHNFVANGIVVHNTLLDILSPLAVPGTKNAVLLVPPALVGQLHAEYLRAAEHFRVPSLVLMGGGGQIRPGMPVLHVVPYSRFSRPESTELLSKQLRPDLIIADEAHKLRDKGTATTSRVLRYFVDNPETRLCAWSGTLTAKSIRDYAHLSAIALGENSPLPLDPQIVEEWSLALDPIEWQSPAGALFALCNPGEGIRDGYRRRLHSTLGVTGTRAAAVDASIIIAEKKAPPMPEVLAKLLRHLRAAWERPDGEELVDVLQVAKSARELACGFYYRWTFPHGEPKDLIAEWYKARSAWHKELREKLKHRTDHLDSPLLCAKAAIRAWQGHGDGKARYDGPLPVWQAASWPAWVEIRERVQPVPEAVWVDDYLARDAAEWAKENRGVVWYLHDAFGRRVAELAGLPLHEGGPDAEAKIAAETGKRSVIASIKAHGTGRDGLQRIFNKQLVANPPASGAEWEQLLGRLHRIGQEADEVETEVYRHTPEMADAIDRAIFQARYIEGTMGTLQKLLISTPTWDLPANRPT